ncbi:tRNA (adenosine(37)-N6)-threonylcarbamoyltransferase complex ATPase subunit type 1 TsaE [Mucilaginibacter ximonensis]|uniref:tRNA threonylcarbamoyladenosine biosynthesis protein TsaE n=1 Tax=Mucilaginibacter ximonensis TaxID=538021 RepID=A0ABW5YDH7_9SPHI
MTINVSSLQELPQAAAQLIAFAGNEKVFIFQGDMGAGKTTFIKAICEALGVQEAVTSPTFAIVNEYKIVGNKIFHFDFYRLKTPTEALDMGAEEYFYSGNYCFIEWPEKIPDMLPSHYISVNIKVSGDGGRQISVEKI